MYHHTQTGQVHSKNTRKLSLEQHLIGFCSCKIDFFSYRCRHEKKKVSHLVNDTVVILSDWI